jgi:hypothetical protein
LAIEELHKNIVRDEEKERRQQKKNNIDIKLIYS